MEAMRLNELLDSFNTQADSVKNKLNDLLVTVSDGRVPGKDELQLFNADMDTLVSEYGKLKEEAESILTADEMPKDGSKASEYVEAVANSKSRIIKLQLEKAESVLRRFLKVKSLIAEYETALSPFKEKAAEVLKNLSEDNIDKMLPETEAPELFLKALDTENIKGQEGFKILGEINKYYPMEVQWGLVGKQYIIDKEAEVEDKAESSVEDPIEQKAEVLETDSMDKEQQEAEVVAEEEAAEPTAESNPTEATELTIDISSDDTETKETTANAEEQGVKVPEEQEVLLTAINKVKSGAPSASSFKKEIEKIAKINKEVKVVLPLMTNLGVLTKEQIYLIGICMGCVEESDRDREKIYAAVEALANKGYLACFEYDEVDPVKEAYCLSIYCHGCLKKDSISVQMRRFWSLSFGDAKVVTSSDMKKDVIEKFIRNNDRLGEYLYAVKDLVEPDEYQRIKSSIKWIGDYYRIAVVKDGETTVCRLYDPENIPDEVKEDGILVVGDDAEISSSFIDGDKKIFVYNNQAIALLGEEKGTSSIDDTPDEKSDKEIEQTEESTTEESKASEKEPKMKTPEKEVKKASMTQEEDPSEAVYALGEISVKSLLEKESIPTDEEFCTVIKQLLNREATTKEQLTSIISQTIAFAKAVGDVATKENGESKDYAESCRLSAQLRLASNLMLNECVYTSKFLSSVFPNPDNDDPAIMLSAYMFAMLIPGMEFDYDMKSQTKIFLDRYENYFDDFAAFKPLFNKLMDVKNATTTGFSPAVVSLLGDEAESERFIDGLRDRARAYLTVKAPKTRMKALPPMYSACFGQGSELYECMSIISENRQEKDDVEYVGVVLGEYCDKKNDAMSLSNAKIEDALTKAWDNANPKNKLKLEYDARDQALRQFNERLTIMLDWVEHMNNRKQDISRLKTLRAELINQIQKIQKNPAWKNQKNANILAWALSYMQLYLNGQVVKLRIYSEFVYTGLITVGNDGIPVIDHDLAHVKYYEPWRNVLRHIVSSRKSVADVKAEIMGDTLDDKADEEGLKDNLHQLEMLGKLLGDDSPDYTITDRQLKEATDSAEYRATRFQEGLELAYTYNQINETEKENLIGIVNQYKARFYDAKDFACWRRFLEALEKQIDEFARGREKQLRGRLESHLKENPESPLLEEANKLLEEEKNFAVAEEYINRFEGGETELDDDEALHYDDCFSKFIEPTNFGPILDKCRKCNGQSLNNFGWNYVERNMPKTWTARNRENSRNLVTNWPKRKGQTTPAQIETLFTGLGFDVIKAERITIKNEEVFKVYVRQTPKGMADYRHPIASFGTQLKSPINAIALYGNYTEKQLVDTVSNLDLGGISIVLLDRPVDVASRRQIGEIFHTQTSGQNPFLLIDQVLFLYLALQQETARMPAMLKCTLPYSTYQPFVRDGGATSDEMFCGRTQELATIIDPNGACVVYGGRQLGKTALLERAESRCSKPDDKEFAVYTTIIRIKSEKEVVETIVSDINKKCDGKVALPKCNTLGEMCAAISKLFRSKKITSMLLLIDEVDDFLASIADKAYRPIQPLVDLKRETKNNFKFVIAGLHNVCRAKNATRDNGIFGQLGTPLCIKPLSPTDALQLISRPLRYLGFQIDRYPHLETILTNTNYYPGILQFFGYMLVETLTGQYSKYYHAAAGNPPFTLRNEQLGAVMNSSDLNKSIKDKFRWSLELDQRYFMIARCITMLYHYYEDDRKAGTWQGFPVDAIMKIAAEYPIHCLENETKKDYINLLDEMVEMGILGKPDENRDLYRLRRTSFVDIIGEDLDSLDADIVNNNEEA